MSFVSTSDEDEDPHSFDSCPLRTSSSLFIVKQQDQTIVTATDEIFNILGYSPSDVIGKTIDQLLKPVESPDNTFPLRCIARDKRGMRIKFQACIHCNPLHHHNNSSNTQQDEKTTKTKASSSPLLDYWLVRPLFKRKKKNSSNNKQSTTTTSRYSFPMDSTTVLLLSPYGIVDRVYHVTNEELQPATSSTRQLIGMPIMAFIHSEDLQILCGQLNMTYQRIQPTSDIRWLTNGYNTPKSQKEQEDDHDNIEEEYQWITVTGMPMSFSARSNHTFKQNAQITCVIEPIAVLQQEECHRYRNYRHYDQQQSYPLIIKKIQDIVMSFYNDLYEKIIAGKVYVFEFLRHVLMNIIPLAAILLTDTTTKANHHDNKNGSNDDSDNNIINNDEKQHQRTRRSFSGNDSNRQQQQQPRFVAVQKMDRIEIVPLVYKVQSSCKAVLDIYYYPIVKDCLSVFKSISNITQLLPPAEIPLSTLESYVEWVTTAIHPTASKRYH